MKRKPSPRSTRQNAARQYPRTARLNALLQEIVADHFEVAGDEELGFFTVTGVEVDNDLNVAEVFVSVLVDDPTPEEDAAFLGALAGHRKAVQRAIAQQAKLRKTPDVVFTFDPGVRTGSHIERILAGLGPIGGPDRPAAAPSGGQPSEATGDGDGDGGRDVRPEGQGG
ncbi:MAG: 30S ribosome-binding factor RbfA [Actinomycetota bacterium]|nr:30S ribosome-binding factor RbfA [Actinomycetota bacterium]